MATFFQDTFDAGLKAFENEGIFRVTSLKDQLVKANHEQSPAIIERHKNLLDRCISSIADLVFNPLLQVKPPITSPSMWRIMIYNVIIKELPNF